MGQTTATTRNDEHMLLRVDRAAAASRRLDLNRRWGERTGVGLSFDTAVLRAAAGSDALVGDAAGLWDTARQAKFPGAL